MSRLLVVVGGLLALVTTALTLPGAKPPKLPKPAVVEAWERAGAEQASLEWDPDQVRRMTARRRPAERAGEVPAFRLDAESKTAALPAPVTPFGLLLSGTGDAQIKSMPAFTRLWYVQAYGAPLTDAAAPDLARQKELRYLDLGRSKMTAVGMKALATLPKLETLHVDSIRVTNSGLAELVKIKTLRDLNLDDSGVTYDALPALAGLQNLETLGLLRVKRTPGKPAGFGDWITKLPKLRVIRTDSLTDADLKRLAGAPALREVAFDADKATLAGVKELARIADLEALTVRDAKWTAAEYRELAALKKVRRLVLVRSNITDADLKAFAGMSSLRELTLRGTRVTKTGITELKKALPKLTIKE